MHFNQTNNNVINKLLVANIPNTLYWRIPTGKYKDEWAAQGTPRSRNISVIFLTDDRRYWLRWTDGGEVATGYLSGRCTDAGDRVYYEVVFPSPVMHPDASATFDTGYIEIFKGSNVVNAWNVTDGSRMGVDHARVTNSLNDILNRHRVIQSNNILCAEVVRRLDSLHIAYPPEKIKEIVTLQSYLENFDESLTRLVSQDGSNRARRYDELDGGNLRNLCLTYQAQMGLVWTASTIIIAVSVIAVFAVAVWLLCEKYNPQSKVALRYSNKLTKELLQYLPKDVYDQLMSENNRFERIANNAIANTAGLGTIKTIGIALIGLFAGKYIFENYRIDRKPSASKKEV